MLYRLKQQLLLILGLGCFLCTRAQYHPAAGQVGSNAISKDSSAFKFWANRCYVDRGFVKKSDTTFVESDGNSNRASFGSDTAAKGKAEGNSMNVVSLGDGGSAILSFEHPIADRAGNDFAVFENSLTDVFLELAFVEVSSDSLNWVRFPSSSLTQNVNQIGAFGNLDPTKINNLAGKYKQGFGTPFDLEELKDSSRVDINNVRFVKIIDVVGSINPLYASYDALGNIINDPWPTPFWSGGFDLDAVGVIHSKDENGVVEHEGGKIHIYPNPVVDFVYVDLESNQAQIMVYDLVGNLVLDRNINSTTRINVSSLCEGVYFVKVKSSEKIFFSKLIKK